MKICDLEKCTGCGACMASCPRKCITMGESDNAGTILPIINEVDCIKCFRCQKVCHVLHNVSNSKPLKCYAARSSDKILRNKGASGGVASSMYKYMIGHNIFSMGTFFDSHSGVRYKEVNSEDDIKWARDSKYVYSDMTNVFDIYKEKIGEGIECVFIGLPCQVAALKKYLEFHQVNQSKIFFVDIVCHGTPNFKYLREHLNYIERKRKKKVDSVHFRQPLSNYIFSCYSCGKRIWLRTMHGNDTYYRGFSLGVFFRENCYSCLYANAYRVSDITLGDYSGLGTVEKYEGDKSQMSLVLCNTERGIKWFDKLCNAGMVEYHLRQVEEAINAPGNKQLRGPSLKPIQKEMFDGKYSSTFDFEKSARHAMRNLFIKYYILFPIEGLKYIIKRVVPNRIKRKIKSLGE